MKFLSNLMAPMGLAWKPIKRATGLTDAQMAGIGALAVGGAVAAPALMGASAAGTGAAAAAPEAGALTLGGGVPNLMAETAAAPESGGLLATMGKAGSAIGTGLGAAGAINNMMKSNPIQASPIQQHQAPDFTGLLNAQAQQQQVMSQEQLARKQQQQQVINGLLNGGLYGRNS